MDFWLASASLLVWLGITRLFQKKASQAFFFGVLSDSVLIGQVMLLAGAVSFYAPVLAKGIWGFCLATIPVLCLADYYLAKHMNIRLRLSLLHNIRSARDFFPSAVAIGFYRWCFWILLWELSLFVVVHAAPQGLHLRLGELIGIFGFLSVATLVLVLLDRRLPSLLVYQAHNLLVLEQKALFQIFVSKEAVQNVTLDDAIPNLQDQQRSIFLDKNYPLLRVTNQFLGPELFSLPSQENAQPNVIFICLESFRSAGISILDSFRPIPGFAPEFQRLAKEGILWRNFYSVSTRSCKALLATLYGIQPQVGDDIFSKNPTFGLRGLPDVLKEKGYHNAYLHNGDISFDRQQEFLLSHAFASLHGRQEIQAASEAKISGSAWGIPDEYLMRHALQFLQKKQKEREACFLYLFTVSNHHPWHLPFGFPLTSFVLPEGISDSPFLQTMQYTDHWLGWFIEQLRSTGILEQSLVCIFGDHGQPIGEHGSKNQQREGIYEESVHVPLLLLGKDVAPAVIDEVSSQIDLFPTFLDLLESTSIHHSAGRSLRRKGKDEMAHLFSPFFPTLVGCRQGDWKLIHNPVTKEDELFHLPSDPGEQTNRKDENPQMLEQMRDSVLKRQVFFEDLYQRHAFLPSQTRSEINLSAMPHVGDKQLPALLEGASPSVLILDGCLRISDSGLETIASKCPNLIRLSLKDCSRITERGLLTLVGKIPRLKIINLSNCLAIDFQKLGPFWAHVPLLQRVLLCNQPFLTDGDIHLLFDHVQHLETFEIPHSAAITDMAIQKLAQSASNLLFFSMNASQVTPASLAPLFSAASQLRGFSIEYGYALSDAIFHECQSNSLSLIKLFACPDIQGHFLRTWKQPHLHAIHFSDMPSLKDEAFEDVGDFKFERVHLHNCPLLTDSSMVNLAKIAPKEVHIINCNNVTRQGIDHLRKTVEQVVWGD